jgi:hypothetical protein
MASFSDLPETMTALASTFGEAGEPVPADHLTLEDVHEFVCRHVEVLLHSNPALLMSIIYKIDVSERKVRRVFEDESGVDLVARLTELIIERQLEKVRIRKQYRDDIDR